MKITSEDIMVSHRFRFARSAGIVAFVALCLALSAIGHAAPYHILVGDDDLGRVRRFNPDTGAEITGAAWTSASVPGVLGVASDPATLKVYANTFGGAVYRLNRDGSLDTSFGGTGSVSVPTGIRSGLAVHSSGDVYGTASNGNIYRITSSGTVTSVTALVSDTDPTDIEFGPGGYLYTIAPSGQIRRYDVTSGTPGQVTPVATGYTGAEDHPWGPTGLAFDLAGNMYTTDRSVGNATYRVRRYSPTADGDSHPFSWINGDWTSGFTMGAYGLEVGPDGRTFASTFSTDQLMRFDASGNPTLLLDDAGGFAFTQLDLVEIPEPSAIAMLSLAAGPTLLLRRRCRRVTA
jgi:hypothetical protein